jgi:general nucleoside transport system permease protein
MVWTSQFLASTLVQTTPILLAALGAMITSRANILNVAIEGMALVAAFTAIAVGQATDSAALGFGCAVLAAVAMALLFGFVAIVLGADFIVAGLGLNILAVGGTLFLLEQVYQDPGGLRPDVFPEIWRVPEGSLAWLPVIGPAFERQSFIVLIALAAVPLSALFLYRTPLGYALRAVGEDESAAIAAGIHAARMKLIAVVISGLFAGLAGAQLAMDRLHFVLPDMTSGRGFIGLPAARFGAARPWPTGGAAFLFGSFGVIGDRLQLLQAPSQFVLMAPYLAALLALVFARWRAQARARPAPVRENPVHETAS